MAKKKVDAARVMADKPAEATKGKLDVKLEFVP